MKKLIGTLSTFAVIALLCLCGCKATLEPGGDYAPAGQVADMPLYTLDAAYKFARTTLDTVYKFEKDNRTVLWKISPEIKHTLDKVWVQADAANKDWAKARQAYLASPVQDNLTAMQTALAKIQQFASAAQAVIPQK